MDEEMKSFMDDLAEHLDHAAMNFSASACRRVSFEINRLTSENERMTKLEDALIVYKDACKGVSASRCLAELLIVLRDNPRPEAITDES